MLCSVRGNLKCTEVSSSAQILHHICSPRYHTGCSSQCVLVPWHTLCSSASTPCACILMIYPPTCFFIMNFKRKTSRRKGCIQLKVCILSLALLHLLHWSNSINSRAGMQEALNTILAPHTHRHTHTSPLLVSLLIFCILCNFQLHTHSEVNGPYIHMHLVSWPLV